MLVPELYVDHWWQHLLHNQSALLLKGRLLFRKETVVTSIPYRVEPPGAVVDLSDLPTAGSTGPAPEVRPPIRSERPSR